MTLMVRLIRWFLALLPSPADRDGDPPDVSGFASGG